MAEHHPSLIAVNRKARQYYEFIDFYEAGIMLTGPEVKSLRQGLVNFRDSYIECGHGEAWLRGLHIAPYVHGGPDQNPDRNRKLLLHTREITVLKNGVEQKGLTIVPVKLYFKRGNVKVEIALARGKKLHDQRQDLKERAENRDMEREIARC